MNNKKKIISLLVLLLLTGCGKAEVPINLSNKGGSNTHASVGLFMTYSNTSLNAVNTEHYTLNNLDTSNCPKSESWFSITAVEETFITIKPDCIRVLNNNTPVADPGSIESLNGHTIETKYNDKIISYQYNSETDIKVLGNFIYTTNLIIDHSDGNLTVDIESGNEFVLNVSTNELMLECPKKTTHYLEIKSYLNNGYDCTSENKDVAITAQYEGRSSSGYVNFNTKGYSIGDVGLIMIEDPSFATYKYDSSNNITGVSIFSYSSHQEFSYPDLKLKKEHINYAPYTAANGVIYLIQYTGSFYNSKNNPTKTKWVELSALEIKVSEHTIEYYSNDKDTQKSTVNFTEFKNKEDWANNRQAIDTYTKISYYLPEQQTSPYKEEVVSSNRDKTITHYDENYQVTSEEKYSATGAPITD